jgi:hypothetical protein
MGRRASGLPWADIAVVAALVSLVCIPVWPGVFTVDSLAILRSARIGTISNWYAPLHAWGWGLVDRVASPSAVFLLGVTAFVTAVLYLTKQFLSGRAARVVTAFTVLFPPVYGMLGWVGRDVWFATAAVAITGAAWASDRRGAAGSAWSLGALVVLAFAAADARQNGAPFALLAVGISVLSATRRLLPRAGVVMRGAMTAAGVGVFWLGLLFVQDAVISERTYPQQGLYIADLVAVSIALEQAQMSAQLFPSQDADMLRVKLAGRDPGNAIYFDPPVLRFGHTDAGTSHLWAEQWRRMIRNHPGRYLQWRTKLYLRQVGLTGQVLTPQFPGSDVLEGFSRREILSAFPELLKTRNRILRATEGKPGWGSPLHTPAIYIAGSVVAIGVLSRRAGRQPLGAALIVVLVAMQGLLFFTSPGSEYRLEYYQVVLGTALGSVMLTLYAPRLWCRRRTSRNRRVPVGQAGDVEREEIVVERAVDLTERHAGHPEDALHPSDD